MGKLNQGLPYYPMFLNISGKRCVVVGGGQVALRKVGVLLEHGASVEVISPDLCSKLIELAESGRIRILRRHYQLGDLQKALIAIAATDNSDINQQVVKEAQGKAVLVNATDDLENSDFIVPSYVRRGSMTIVVSTAGRSPALARKIRARLEKEFGDEYASLVNLIGEVRAEVKRQGIKVSGNDWQEALDLDLMIDLLKRGDDEEAKAILLGNLKARQK
ncbi:MAG: bifunctional precorrin-2 dehydrogenase/sirohydrochlorin ferrochelatase [Dehalococcoidia bacterium]|nr:bifunctional precorrin-2 dehydrogenase/sirohydrochlorin ferrochelatase [Dehalococcoidia bacterium]